MKSKFIKRFIIYLVLGGGLVSCSPQGYGYVDKTGKVAIAPRFGDASGFSEGLAEVAIGLKSGYIDKTGKLVIFPVAGGGFPFSNGLAPVRRNSQWGHIDRTGKLVISPQFDEAAKFSTRLAGLNMSDRYHSNNLGDTQPALFEYVRYLGHIPTFLNIVFRSGTGGAVFRYDL